MTMSNGTQEAKMKFKARKGGTQQIPELPEGKWGVTIKKGGSKVLKTQKGDPRVLLAFKVTDTPDGQETFKGAETQYALIGFDPDENRKGYNMTAQNVRALCKAVDAEPSVWPEDIEDEHSFDAFLEAVEGSSFDIWVTHRTYTTDSGEERTNLDIRFTEPGRGLVTKSDDDDDDDRPAKKPAAKAKSKR